MPPREQEPDAITILFEDGTEEHILFTEENKTILLPKTGDAALKDMIFYQNEKEIGRLTQLNIEETSIEDFNKSDEPYIYLK